MLCELPTDRFTSSATVDMNTSISLVYVTLNLCFGTFSIDPLLTPLKLYRKYNLVLIETTLLPCHVTKSLNGRVILVDPRSGFCLFVFYAYGH